MGILTLLLLFLIPIASAQFINPNDPIALRNFAVSDDGKDIYFAAHRSPDGSADQGWNLYRYQSASRTATKCTNH